MPAIAKVKESTIKDKVKKVLRAAGAWYNMPVPWMGTPTVDFLVCHCGRFIAIETKRPGGKLTAMQLRTLNDIQEADGTTFVITNDWEIEVFARFLAATEQHRPRKISWHIS